MSMGTVSFIGWVVVMVVALVGLITAARRSRRVQDETEHVASKALPTIGGIAERKHQERFGHASACGKSDVNSWYPPSKRRAMKAAMR